jgi:hypothetical protein
MFAGDEEFGFGSVHLFGMTRGCPSNRQRHKTGTSQNRTEPDLHSPTPEMNPVNEPVTIELRDHARRS